LPSRKQRRGGWESEKGRGKSPKRDWMREGPRGGKKKGPSWWGSHRPRQRTAIEKKNLCQPSERGGGGRRGVTGDFKKEIRRCWEKL